MITREFQFDSAILLSKDNESPRTFIVTIEITCRDNEGETLDWNFESIIDEDTGLDYGLDSFWTGDKSALETMAQSEADKHWEAAWIDYYSDLTDKAYEDYKDGLYDRE